MHQPIGKLKETKVAALFLDRDGTIITEVNYLHHPNQIQLIPEAIPALQKLQRHFKLILITNQAGVAKGYLNEQMLRHIHGCLEHKLWIHRIRLAGIYYCPHHPQAVIPFYRKVCPCRKPAPGMLLAAAVQLGLDLGSSYTIGDKLSDIEAGQRAGTKTVLVRTGYGKKHEMLILPGSSHPEFVGEHLEEAADWILENTKPEIL